MSYVVLARKYRPQTFEDVVEQSHVTRTLANAISSDRMAHAVLFAGPRGTGKTTVARILAKAMNCEQGPSPTPCNTCRSCKEITGGGASDVFEIDGASNNGVDQIRELRENLKYLPGHSRYKIYIIDEVHMLSIQAFNALLKTLEEPPPHVLFMFATTEPHKIPITILSRCQRHDLKRIDMAAIVAHMGSLCRREEIPMDEESLGLIARESDGSMRDALSLLDQVMTCAEGGVTHEQVLEILGIVDRKVLFDLAGALIRRDAPGILDILDRVYDHGYNLKELYGQLVEHLRNLLVIGMGKTAGRLVDVPDHERGRLAEQAGETTGPFLTRTLDLLLREEPAIKHAVRPRIAMEMALLRPIQAPPPLTVEALIGKLDAFQEALAGGEIPAPAAPKPAPSAGGPAPDPIPKPAAAPAEEAEPTSATPPPDPAPPPPDAPPETRWKALVDCISEAHPSLGACLSKCTLKSMDTGRLEIESDGNGFNLNRINRNTNQLREVCRTFFGREMDLVIHANEERTEQIKQKKARADQRRQEALDHPMVGAALDLFDGKVVDVKVFD